MSEISIDYGQKDKGFLSVKIDGSWYTIESTSASTDLVHKFMRFNEQLQRKLDLTESEVTRVTALVATIASQNEDLRSENQKLQNQLQAIEKEKEILVEALRKIRSVTLKELTDDPSCWGNKINEESTKALEAVE